MITTQSQLRPKILIVMKIGVLKVRGDDDHPCSAACLAIFPTIMRPTGSVHSARLSINETENEMNSGIRRSVVQTDGRGKVSRLPVA